MSSNEDFTIIMVYYEKKFNIAQSHLIYFITSTDNLNIKISRNILNIGKQYQISHKNDNITIIINLDYYHFHVKFDCSSFRSFRVFVVL